MPENMVNNTLQTLMECGIIDRFIEFAKSSQDMDYETLSFVLQLGCKISIIPGGMDKLLQSNLITLGYQNILKRNFVLHNIKRFAGSDSTNALLVLADELIDLVNVNYS